MVITEAGNLSVRLRRHALVTRRGARLDRLSARDLVAVPLDGTPAAGGTEPSSETPMHLGVYRHCGAGAIVHTHSRMATVLSTLVDEIPPIHYAMHRLGDSVRVARYATFGSDELAANVVAALAGRSAALMANHGAIAHGPDLAEALARAQTLEWLADIHYHAIAVGPPAVLGPADLAAVRARAGVRR